MCDVNPFFDSFFLRIMMIVGSLSSFKMVMMMMMLLVDVDYVGIFIHILRKSNDFYLFFNLFSFAFIFRSLRDSISTKVCFTGYCKVTAAVQLTSLTFLEESIRY